MALLTPEPANLTGLADAEAPGMRFSDCLNALFAQGVSRKIEARLALLLAITSVSSITRMPYRPISVSMLSPSSKLECDTIRLPLT